MKTFLKYTLATITGLFIASILFFIIFFVSMSAIIASSNKDVSISDNSVLVLNTGLKIPERGNDDPFASLSPSNLSLKTTPGLNDIIKNLDKAARDENIKGVVIENSPQLNGWAKAREIREALKKFKESGKFIVAYTDFYLTQEAYYISSVADKIYLNPVAIMEFKGIGSQVLFYKDALKKIGVEIQVVKHGKYKGAVEKFTNSSLSPENRAQIEVFTNGIWNGVLSEISVARSITVDKLNIIADELSCTKVSNAIDLNMVDGVLYRDEFVNYVKNLADSSSTDKPEKVTMAKYSNVKVSGAKSSSNKIAVVYAEGTIVMGKGDDTNIGGKRFATQIRKIRENDKYKALVLRVNSPGGVAIASDYIWREVALAAEKMPVVVSMSNYAASGGYYIACAADAIFSQPHTLTGSIGVFGMMPQAEKLFNDKLGISSEKVMTNKYADSPSQLRPMDSYETEMMQSNVDIIYDDFITKVSEGRNIDKNLVDELGQGHVYFGNDALDNKLIDYIGGLSDAIEHAAKLSELDDYRIVELPEVEDMITKMMKSVAGDIKAKILSKELGPAIELYNDINELREMSGIQARLPYYLKMR